MVLGYSLLPCGMGLMFRSLGMAFIVPAVVLVINIILVKAVEEPNLEKRFGETYREYKAKTPFLILNKISFIRHIYTLFFKRRGKPDENGADCF
jgi:protein-S-isoprenylcysteine O-methyltransferase Ste14